MEALGKLVAKRQAVYTSATAQDRFGKSWLPYVAINSGDPGCILLKTCYSFGVVPSFTELKTGILQEISIQGAGKYSS
jgi:hypothetical protein